MQFSCFSVLPDSTKAQVIWGGLVKRLFVAYIISNISAKNIKIRSHVSKLQQAEGGTFFDTLTTQKHKKLKPDSIASYDTRPAENGGGPILVSALHKFVTYLLRHLPTYLQPRDLHGAYGQDGSTCQLSISNAIQFKGCCPETNTHRTDCSACATKLNWSVTTTMPCRHLMSM